MMNLARWLLRLVFIPAVSFSVLMNAHAGSGSMDPTALGEDVGTLLIGEDVGTLLTELTSAAYRTP